MTASSRLSFRFGLALALLALAALACSTGPLLVTRAPESTAGAGTAAPTVTRAPTHPPRPTATPRVVPPPMSPTPPPTNTPRRTATATSTRKPLATPTRMGRTAVPTAYPTAEPVISHPVDPAPYAAGMLPAELGGIARLDDATVYGLQVTINWDDKTVGGLERVAYTNNEAGPLDTLYLRLYPNAEHYREGQTDIASVAVNGEAAQFTVDGTMLAVALPQPLAPEAQAALAIDFMVAVPENTDRFGWQDDVLSLGHWYPVMAVYDDEGWNLDPYVASGDAFYSEVSFYDVEVNAPADLVLATTGVPAGERTEPDGTVTRTFLAPAVRDFAIAASPDYEVETRTVNGTTVRSFYLPGDASAGADAAEWGATALETYNDLFGTYPYSELDIAETIFRIYDSPGGMEFPNVLFISSDFYEAGLYGDYHETVLAHEIAHQWWYGVVGDNQVDEPWLDEAFATYASIAYAYQVNGADTGDTVLLEQAVAAYMVSSVFGTIEYPVGSSLLDFNDDIFTYQGFVYGKGASFLYILRDRLGEETFDAMLRTYFQQHRYGVLAPDAFRQALASVTRDADILDMYDSWILTDDPHLDEAMELVDIGGLP